MISRKAANLIIFVFLAIITLLALSAFIYTALSPKTEDSVDILVGTGIGVVSGVSLFLYIWSNRSEFRE